MQPHRPSSRRLIGENTQRPQLQSGKGPASTVARFSNARIYWAAGV